MNLLPENCIAHILSFTISRNVCRSSLISLTFRLAADSNVVWEKFLPSDIMSRLCSPVVSYSLAKELYFHLCNPARIDEGKMTFSLEKSSGKKCYMISARELFITWGNEFSEVVELRTICWLEIHGKFSRKMLSPETKYKAYGLDTLPSETSVKVWDQRSQFSAYLCHCDTNKKSPDKLCILHRFELLNGRVDDEEHRVPCCRDDGWMQIELGRFASHGGGCDCGTGNGDGDEVKMSLLEVNGYHLKGGLVIERIEIRPKD
ncbi:hypothetical protein MKW94_022151 [Papaver nudicaule]|uniref:F-box domain-containing protein n=1 Tax=Papaver nudicaule TaxID=74823 RepID=A0AA41V465_PAPNU|nr:hypothetical protein [Papaver nudicaule]